MASPITNIRIVKSPLTLDNKNQLTFNNKEEQFEFFDDLEYLEVNDASYQRKDNIIRFPEHIDNILEFNYCMYQNLNYNNKWFYAFIVNKRYENDGMTYISILTDVFQTWQFDLDFKQSFIEREMINVADDIAGANLMPEGLETGEFQIDGTAEFEDLEPAYIIAYSGDSYTDASGETHAVKQEGYSYNGIYSSVTFIVCNEYGFHIAMAYMNLADNSAKVLTVFTVPKLAVKSLLPDDPEDIHTYFWDFIEENFKENPVVKNLVSTPSALDGYIPRNQKLRTYPYMYLGFNPQNGSKKIFRYEDFENGLPSFKIMSEINPNPTIQFIPQNYRGQTGDSLSDAVSMNGYPTISFKNDYFNTWLAQNGDIVALNMQQEQYNYEVSAIREGINLGSQIASAGMAGFNMDLQGAGNALVGTANSAINLASLDVNHEFYIKQQLAQIEKQKMLPDNVTMGSSNATLLGYDLMDNNIFTRYTIKRQFAEKIDKFFDMYGYLTNIVKVPNLKNRPNWNYIKTIGANILGDIPQGDLQIIKNMFDNGVTLWHNPETFLDYSQNNR